MTDSVQPIPETVPPKRQRGRPRKHPLVADAAKGILFQQDATHKRRDQGKVPTEEELFGDHQTYCEELLSIRDKRGELIPFRWNYTQERLNGTIQEASRKGFRHFLILKYRRPGITTFFQSLSFFHAANREGQYCVTLAHDSISTAKIFEIALLFYNRTPDWAKPKRKTENKRELVFPGLGSQFYIGTAGSEDFGRGSTFQIVHGSEVAFWPKSTNVHNLMAGLSEATSHGKLFLESTANGVGNWFHKTWVGAKNRENNYFPIFLSWKDDPELQIPTKLTLEEMKLDDEEQSLVKAYSLTPSQLMWRRQKMKDLWTIDRGNLTFKQEYPINDIEAFISSGITFFDTEICSKLVNLCSPAQYTTDSGRMKVFVQPITHHSYVVGGDIGEGVPGGNNTVLTVYDVLTCEEVACWVGITSPEDAARKMVDLARLYNNALVAPEANNYGHSTINTILHELSYPHIYRHTDYQKINVDGGEVQPKYGWQTNQKTRPMLLSEFRYALQGGLLKANDPELFSECLSFVDNGHGKYEAAQGAKDDRVMAHAIAWQARQKATETVHMTDYIVDTGYLSVSARWEDI